MPWLGNMVSLVILTPLVGLVVENQPVKWGLKSHGIKDCMVGAGVLPSGLPGVPCCLIWDAPLLKTPGAASKITTGGGVVGGGVVGGGVIGGVVGVCVGGVVGGVVGGPDVSGCILKYLIYPKRSPFVSKAPTQTLKLCPGVR